MIIMLNRQILVVRLKQDNLNFACNYNKLRKYFLFKKNNIDCHNTFNLNKSKNFWMEYTNINSHTKNICYKMKMLIVMYQDY